MLRGSVAAMTNQPAATWSCLGEALPNLGFVGSVHSENKSRN